MDNVIIKAGMLFFLSFFSVLHRQIQQQQVKKRPENTMHFRR